VQVRLFREEAPPAPPGEPPVAFDVEYERRIAAEAEARRSSAAGPSAASDALRARVQAFAEAAQQHVGPGVSGEDARLAVAMVGPDAAPQVVEFATSCAQLRAMGFPAEVVCGALLHTKDLEQAASRCLTG
jgi:hypothetical protein